MKFLDVILYFYYIVCCLDGLSVHLYNTKYPSLSNSNDNNCIYHYASTENEKGRHLVPYCLRVDDNTERLTQCYGTTYTFDILRQMNISGNDLFSWFAPTDLINDYELFLTGQESNYQLNEYCNCSSTTLFGSHCQYEFGLSHESPIFSFDLVIKRIFTAKYKRSIHDLNIDEDLTCYLLFNCTSNTGLCLDWRQICDGRFDCTNGEDERNCLEMEFNECDIQNEYRCRNGMCIPRIFSFDLTMDCLDFYDEQEHQDNSHLCYWHSSADCDEHHCGRLGSASFSCGDGSCRLLSYPLQECNTHRDNLQLRHLFAYDKKLYDNARIFPGCLRYVRCKLGIYCLFYPCLNANTPTYCDDLPNNEHFQCNIAGWNEEAEIIRFFFPPVSIIYPFVRLLYTEYFQFNMSEFLWLAICINISIPCNMTNFTLSDDKWQSRPFIFEEFKCYHVLKFSISYFSTTIIEDIKTLVAHCAFPSTSNHLLPNAFLKSAFICNHRLGISYHRVDDRHLDCNPDGTDEKSIKTDLHSKINIDRFMCSSDVGIPRRFVADKIKDCKTDELFPVSCTNNIDCQFLREFDFSHQIPMVEFNAFCNGYTTFINENFNDTDETDCEEWPCLSRATRCDGAWNRLNGCDELNCPLSLPSAYIAQRAGRCSLNEHYCLHYNSSTIKCLPVEKANDGEIDCLFASDERWTEGDWYEYIDQNNNSLTFIAIRFRCTATHHRQFVFGKEVCNCNRDCGRGADDELVCPWQYSRYCSSSNSDKNFICENGARLDRKQRCDQKIDCIYGEDEWACDFDNVIYPYRSKPFRSDEQTSISPMTSQMKSEVRYKESLDVIFYCHRGILIRTKENHPHCLCPPSFFGSRCQYQSERLTISFDSEILRTSIDLNAIYHLVFYLLNEDEQEIISLETFVYAPSIHSSLKHLIYLTYPRKYLLQSPHQRQSGKIFLHVNTYRVTNTSVEHSLSWRYSVQFPFLPVNRLAFRLVFQESRHINPSECARLGCKNGGACQIYVNTNQSFCRCSPNWSGLTCEKQMICVKRCSEHSKCINLYNHTFCLCSLGQIGHNCLVKYDACSGIHCQNNGTCVTGDIRTKQYICQCSREYFGRHCEYKNARLFIDISEQIDFIPILNILMMHLPSNVNSFLMYRNAFFYKNIPSKHRIIIIEENQPFLSMFIFAQIITDYNSIYGTYYLLNYTSMTDINELNTSLTLDKRCPHISEYLDEEIMKLNWLKRVKIYHKYFKDVQCFYDEYYMCLIDENKLPECFHFDHSHSNCSHDHQYCENGGRCFQHKQQHTGELSFACICPECFTGSFCQLDMNQFLWTLDSLFSGIIIVDAELTHQPLTIKLVLAFISILCFIGLISNVASFLTFIRRKGQKVGSAYYLLTLSIISPITLLIFLFRFIHLLVSQISLIENDQLLFVGCLTLDFLLGFLISICDWLTACLTCERTASVIKGVNFNRQKSIRAVKIMIPLLFIILTLSSCHQLFSRHLINDPRNDARRWCLIKYQYQWIQTYDITIRLINCTIPFLVNFVSTIILLVAYTQTKHRANNNKNYSIILAEQVRQHKHLIITPLIMITFKLPLFIVQITFKCIVFPWQLYTSIIVYLISYMPLATTFILFVCFSPSYYKLFLDKWIRRK